MEITIDLSELEYAFESANPLLVSWVILKYGGWVIFVILFLWMIKDRWLFYIRTKYRLSQDYILLAIDIPKENEQTPKAVESIFTTIAGSHSSPNLIEKYIKGEINLPFSFELVSIEGYIQFLIRLPVKYRDLIEATVYAQYPDAQISEVSDYCTDLPEKYPDKEYDLYGTEFILAKADPYPIRTYPLFEHSLSQKLIDPMASLLEVLSKLGKGEQVWLQLIIRPTNDSWKDRGEEIVKKLIGAKAESKKGLVQKFAGATVSPLLREATDVLLKGANIQPSETEAQKKNEMPSLMQYLSPGERNIVETIQNKISKIGFTTKLRFIYIAKKEVFTKSRGVHPIAGAISQFKGLDINGFRTAKKTRTKIDYLFIKLRTAWRQEKIIKAYKDRSFLIGPREFILNTEELASLYHFPTLDVKAPLVKKVESKKVEPPFSLPTGREEVLVEEVKEAEGERSEKTIKEKKQEEELLAKVSTEATEAEKSKQEPGGPPPNLPI